MQICTNCYIGKLHSRTAAYAAWHGDQFIVVSNSSTWECDVCGERAYDDAVYKKLMPLVGPPAQMPDGNIHDNIDSNQDQFYSLRNDRQRGA